jgi:hypothetical protein
VQWVHVAAARAAAAPRVMRLSRDATIAQHRKAAAAGGRAATSSSRVPQQVPGPDRLWLPQEGHELS